MSVGKKYTYWQFIKENGVVIPLIQRDYAQGREGKEELRKRFLKNIKDALLHKTTAEPLILDFVYGVDDNKNIIPLDGQQRLTTLWLIHWYVYLKSEKNIKPDNLNYFQKFTYQTRISSRRFCEELVNQNHFRQLRKLAMTESIKECIVKQTWFMSEWEQDPTVKSMLNMLGGRVQSIESIFKDCNSEFDNLWEKLTSDSKCPIVFYYLPIDGEIIQDPDDIYIKVNARGEHLTDFENFKADLIKFIGEHSDGWKDSFGENSGLELSRLMDKEWTDVFWTDLPKESKVNTQIQSDNNDIALPNIDKQFFAFLNRYFLNQILVKTQKNAESLNKKDSTDGETLLFQYLYGKEGKADINLIYKDFQRYRDGGVITVDTFKALKTIFDVLRTEIVDIQPVWNKDEKFHFLPYLIKSEKSQSENEERLKDISQIYRVVFFGICCYLEECNDDKPFNRDSFKEWMRFVWNMAYNSDVQTIDNMKKVILKINDVRDGTHDIITFFKKSSRDNEDSYLSRQWNEEIEKANIYDQKKDQIKNAEKIFHGSIRFLIKCKDILEEKYIERAQQELFPKDNDFQWILKILPFFPKDDQYQKISVTFYESKRDTVEIINRDKHIIEAVQTYLTQELDSSQSLDYEPWIETLLKIRKGDASLFDYSTSKKIQSYFGWNDIPKGVYLYNRSNWKKDDCILLSSPEDEQIQNFIDKRNAFVFEKLNNGYELYLDDNDYKKVSYHDVKAYEGRAIGLKKESDIIYCWASGYRQGDKDSLIDYPSIIEIVT